MRVKQPYGDFCYMNSLNRRLYSFFLFAALLAVASPSYSDEHIHELAKDSIVSLKGVEVTAKRNPMTSMQELSGQQLQSLSSSSIADALKYFAGVQIKDYGGLGGMKTVNVRSLGAQHVGIYIDGIRVTNAQNGTVDLGKFSLSSLESVQLHNANRLERAQSASEYASGATVYLQTRKPQCDSLTLLAGIASFHTYQGRFNLQFLRKGWSGFIEGEYINSKGDYPFRYKSEYEDTVGKRKNSDIEFFRMEGALFYKGFSSHLYGYSSRRGCPGGIVRRLSDKYMNIGREWNTDMFIQTSWQHSFAHSQLLRLNLKYSHEYLRYNTNFPDNQNTARADNRYNMDDTYLSVAYYVSPLQWFGINLSSDCRYTWLESDLRYFSAVRRLDQKAVADLLITWKSFRLETSLLYQYYHDKTKVQAGAAKPISKLTPGVVIGWFWQGLGIRAWYKKIFRVPTLNDLYYTQAGNRNLKPEYTRQWNIGAEYSFSIGQLVTSAKTDAYINHIDNRIVCLPLRGTYTWSMMNYGRTWCRGINVSFNASYILNRWYFSLVGSLTLQHDVNRTDSQNEDTYDMPICYSPKFSSGVSAVAAWRNFSLTVSELYVSKRMWSYADSEDILKPYLNTDMRLTGKWKWFEAALEINDIFDVQYEHIPRYPMPGRNFKFTLIYTIGKTNRL